jgi:hypothetical protein
LAISSDCTATLAESVAHLTEQCQRLLLAGGGSHVIADQPLHDTEVIKGRGLTCQVIEIAEQRQ